MIPVHFARAMFGAVCHYRQTHEHEQPMAPKTGSAALDSAAKRDSIVESIAAGATQAAAAAKHGLSRGTVSRRVKSDPVFGARVRTAAKRARLMREETARQGEATTPAPLSWVPEQPQPNPTAPASSQPSSSQPSQAPACPTPDMGPELGAPVADLPPRSSPARESVQGEILAAIDTDAAALGLPSKAWIIQQLKTVGADSQNRGQVRALGYLVELVIIPPMREAERVAAAERVGPEIEPGEEKLQVRLLLPVTAPAEQPAQDQA